MNQAIDRIHEMMYESSNGMERGIGWIVDEVRCPECGRLLCKHVTGRLEIKCRCNAKIRIIVKS